MGKMQSAIQFMRANTGSSGQRNASSTLYSLGFLCFGLLLDLVFLDIGCTDENKHRNDPRQTDAVSRFTWPDVRRNRFHLSNPGQKNRREYANTPKPSQKASG